MPPIEPSRGVALGEDEDDMGVAVDAAAATGGGGEEEEEDEGGGRRKGHGRSANQNENPTAGGLENIS